MESNSLSEDQIKKIDENKQKALAILNSKKELVCTCSHSEGQRCTNKSIDKVIFENFNIMICYNCKKLSDDYDFINKTEAIATHMITEDSLHSLKFILKDNPHRKGWTQMKLYLRKQIKELQMERFGSEENFEREKKRRKELKFEKELKSTQTLLDCKTEEFKSSLLSVNKIYDNCRTNKNKDISNYRVMTEKNSSKFADYSVLSSKKINSKKRKSLLGIVECIQGVNINNSIK